MSRPGVVLAGGIAAVVLIAVPAARGKDFAPGDLRVCGPARCVPVVRREAVAALARLYYTGARPAVVARPAWGARAYELRFRNGYATGVVAAARLDRFLSFGVHLERFRRGVWYRVPPLAAAELRRLTAALAPYRVTRALVARSR